MNDIPFRSGFIAIAGRPNVGKSTLLNHILGQKVTIVTPKAQTTRTRVMGILHRPNSQMVFVDTPGMQLTHHKTVLHRAMQEMAMQTCRDVDLILYMIDASRHIDIDAEDWQMIDRLPQQEIPLILLINKIDRLARERLLPKLAQLEQTHPSITSRFAEIIPISAKRGDSVAHLIALLEDRYLPEGPQHFPEDQVTDQPERFIAAEIIREKLFLLLQDELPYLLAVQIDNFAETEKVIQISASILTGRATHKAMIIGRHGQLLKKVGQQARIEMETIFDHAVYLQLWVKVEEKWADDWPTLLEIGYPSGRDHAYC